MRISDWSSDVCSSDLLTALVPMAKLGSEFMPAMDEGTLLYMPTALPGLSAGKASQLLQLTDRMIKTVPEVEHVFGKAGRAETATDPAPLEMFETTITFKPKDQWLLGMPMDRHQAEMDKAVPVPETGGAWSRGREGKQGEI